MLQLETLIKAIGETAGIDYVEHLIDYELKKDTQNVRYSDSGKVKTITEKDVTDIQMDTTQKKEVDISYSDNKDTTVLNYKTYDGYPKLKEELDPDEDKKIFSQVITVQPGQSQDEKQIEYLYDVIIRFGDYQYEQVSNVLNSVDATTQVLLTGESCCLIKFVLFWYFHNKDFNGSTDVKILSNTGLPDFQYHNKRFMQTVKSELAKSSQILANIQKTVQTFYDKFYNPVIIQSAKSLDNVIDMIYNISQVQSFFKNNLADLFKNPSSIGQAILGILEGIVQAILAQQIQALIQVATLQQDLLKKKILDSIAASLKQRMFYFSVIKSNFLAYYGNQNVKVKTLHDIFEQKYLPNVTGYQSGFVNCNLIVNFTSQFLDIMSYAPIIEIIDQLLSQLIVMLFKFLYSLLKEQFEKLALEGLWQNLTWQKVSGLEAQQKQLWSTIQAVLKRLQTSQSMLEKCILNTGRQYATAEEDYVVKQINKLFDIKAFNKLLDQMEDVPLLEEVAKKLRKLIDFLKIQNS